ncbi:hypothetical protein D3C72_2241340 [compost metagenome]
MYDFNFGNVFHFLEVIVYVDFFFVIIVLLLVPIFMRFFFLGGGFNFKQLSAVCCKAIVGLSVFMLTSGIDQD